MCNIYIIYLKYTTFVSYNIYILTCIIYSKIYICTLSYHTFDIDTSFISYYACILMILEHMYRVIKIPLFPLFSFLI